MKIILSFIFLLFSVFFLNAQTYRVIDGKPKNSQLVQSLIGCKGTLDLDWNKLYFNLYGQEGDKELSYILSPTDTGDYEFIYRFGTEPFSNETPGYVLIKNMKFDIDGIESFTCIFYVFGNSDLYEFRFARRN